MLYFSFSALINALTSLFAGIIVLSKNFKSELNRSFAFFAFSVSFWSSGYFLWQISTDSHWALFWCRVLMMGAIFIPSTFYHFCVSLIHKNLFYRTSIKFFYFLSVIFLLLNFTPLFVEGVVPRMYFPYWPEPGMFFIPFLCEFIMLAIYSHYLMYQSYKKLSGLKRKQIKYVFLGTAIGFIGGSTNYFLWFKIDIPPIGNILVSVYVFLLAYSVIRYRLMDIKVVVTRAGLFILIYTLVLGIPVCLGLNFLGTGLWMLPVFLMGIFATLGPFIYLYMQRKAEAQLLAEQHQYQATLRRASLGMGRIKDLKHLLNLMVHIVTRTVRIEHASVHLLHRESGKFILKASKGYKDFYHPQSTFKIKSPLVKYLMKIKEPFLTEEITHKAHDFRDQELLAVYENISGLKAELVVPCLVEDKLLAFISLGKRRQGKMYNQDDLIVFSILASQSALAIENAMFYEDVQKTTEQLFKAEKMATLGTMADGLSHQINNRLHSMGFVAGDALDTIRMFKKKGKLAKNIKELLDDLEYALSRIEDNVKRGGEIVGGLLRYTRKGEEGFEAVELSPLLDAALEMAQFKIKLNQFQLDRNFNGTVPKIRGNFTQLQEVLFNIVDNAYDAMMQRKKDLKESDYQPCLQISTNLENNKLNVVIEDNGIGVKPQDMNKLFTPFFTTKATSKKGTGLGMYVIRQIIEENHGGKVNFSSRYKRGSKTVLTLPKY